MNKPVKVKQHAPSRASDMGVNTIQTPTKTFVCFEPYVWCCTTRSFLTLSSSPFVLPASLSLASSTTYKDFFPYI